jgi:hypothetical protein
VGLLRRAAQPAVRLKTVNLFKVTIEIPFPVLEKGLITRDAGKQAQNQRVADTHQTVQEILGTGTPECKF